MHDILINNGFSDTEVAMVNEYSRQFGNNITIFKLGADDIHCVRNALGNCVYSAHKYISTTAKIIPMGPHWTRVSDYLPEVYERAGSCNSTDPATLTKCRVTHPNSYCGTSAVSNAVFHDGTGCSCNYGFHVDNSKCVSGGPAPPTPTPEPTPPPGPPSPTPPPSPGPGPSGNQFGNINLQSGYATQTSEGALSGGHMACGQAGMSAKMYGVDALGALPQNLYSRVGGINYNIDNPGPEPYPEPYPGPYKCTEGEGLIHPLIDKTGQKVCYELSGSISNKTITIYPVDTCNGSCIQGFNPKNDCAKINSCMDIIALDKTYDDQRNTKLRCPPTVLAAASAGAKDTLGVSNKIQTFKEINDKLKTAFKKKKTIGEVFNSIQYGALCPTYATVDLPNYAKKPGSLTTKTIGYCDHCSGYNMHFDIQLATTGNSPFFEGEVIFYNKISCPIINT